MKRFLKGISLFLILAQTGFAVIDGNGNGLSDFWERKYNEGELFLPSQGSQDDPDGDGWDNASEAAAGTDPFDANPPGGMLRPDLEHIPAVHGPPDEYGNPIVISGEAVRIFWVATVGKRFSLLFSPDLTTGSWITVGSAFVGNGNEISYTFHVDDDSACFWRVAVSDADTDGDQLTDTEELALGSSRFLADTNGDGINDYEAFTAGLPPGGDDTDNDGDGIPDREIYSLVFETAHESRALVNGIGGPPFQGSTASNRYLTSENHEIYSISNSPEYSNVEEGSLVTTMSWLNGAMLDVSNYPGSRTSVEGESFSAWKQSHRTPLGAGELLSKDTAVITTATSLDPTLDQTTTTKTTGWRVVKNQQTIRSGTEVITQVSRKVLKDPISFQDWWRKHLDATPWTQSPPLTVQVGPLSYHGDEEREDAGDAATAESIREDFQADRFNLSERVSLMWSDFHYHRYHYRLKSLRWRWVRFNPDKPFEYEYAAPPGNLKKTVLLRVDQSDEQALLGTVPRTILLDDSRPVGVISLECPSDQGGTDWVEVPLSRFDPFRLNEPAVLDTTDYSMECDTTVRFEHLPALYPIQVESEVSADDHLSHIVLDVPDYLDEEATVEWEISSGSDGSLAETVTPVKDGLTSAVLNTSTIKGSSYKVRARFKTLKDSGEGFEGNSAWLESPEIRVVAGKPETFAFAKTKASYRSDGTDTSEITATIKDQYGNLVEDDTSVSWAVGQSATTPFVSMENSTVDGIARATLRAPLIPDDQVVTCGAGDVQDDVTIAVSGVTGSMAGNLDLDIGAAQQSTITVSAQAADGSPVYWTSSNGTITSQSTITGGSATATLDSSRGMLGKVVVTATVGDHLFFTEGEFTSSLGTVFGADHPVLIAGATADGVHTPVFAHGIPRQIPFYASTPVRIKGPPNGIVNLDFQASVSLDSWAFDESAGASTPSAGGLHGMTLTNAIIEEDEQLSGGSSLLLDGNGSGSIPDHGDFHFVDQLDVSLRLKPLTHGGATLVSKGGSWSVEQLADGKARVSVVTTSGTHVATTESPLPLSQWSRLTVDFRFDRLLVKVDERTVAEAATTGTLIGTTSPIVIGTGFLGNLDNLSFRKGDSTGSYATFTGVDPGNTVQLDANGEGTFTITSSGAASGDDALHLRANAAPAAGNGPASVGNPLDDPDAAEAIVRFADAVAWDATYDTVMSFIGGDPQTTQGTFSSIAGGFLVVGDVGSVAKNLWRTTGWTDKKPNYVELTLGGLGVITTFVQPTGVGAAADAGLASVKTLAIRFVGNPKAEKFLDVFVTLIKNAAVLNGKFGAAEANFLQKMVLDIPVADAFKLFMHDEGLARAAIRATEKLGANAESFYQATRRAVAAHGEEAAKKFVQVFEGMGDEALAALKNAPAGELDEALDALAKLAKKGFTPFSITRLMNNKHLYGIAYKRTHLLKDMGVLSEVPGMESAIKMLKINHRNVKGFRYEIEGAASLSRTEVVIHSISEKVSVLWDDLVEMGFGRIFGRKTDIDVITELNGVLTFRQFKSTAAAMKSPKKVAAWCEKARKARGNGLGNYEGLIFHLPPDEIPKIAKSVKKWLDDRNIPIESISMSL